MTRIAIMLATAACVAGAAAAAPAEEQSKGPYQLQIKLEVYADGEWKPVDEQHVFDSGDRVRFRAKANFDGYLYVTNHGTSGAYRSLFPSAEAGMENRIDAGAEYVVPQTEDGAFRIEAPPGHEIVYWTLTPARVGEPDPLPPSHPSETAEPARLQPRCDDTILRARGECIDHSAGMQQDRRTRSRGLVFLKNEEASVVAASPELSGPVTFEFRLAHR